MGNYPFDTDANDFLQRAELSVTTLFSSQYQPCHVTYQQQQKTCVGVWCPCCYHRYHVAVLGAGPPSPVVRPAVIMQSYT